jgi:hypothetical protein
MSGFSVELDELERVATDKLPMAIRDLEAAGGHVATSCREAEHALTAGPATVDTLARVVSAWTDASARLRGDITGNRENLDLARTAVLEIVRRYRFVDGRG